MNLEQFEPVFFDLQHCGDITVARVVVPRLTEEENIEQLGQELFTLADQFERRKIVLNLEVVEYLTSSMIGKMITLHRRLHRQQGRLYLCQLTHNVQDILQASRLHTYFSIVPTIADAIAALQQPDSTGE